MLYAPEPMSMAAVEAGPSTPRPVVSKQGTKPISTLPIPVPVVTGDEAHPSTPTPTSRKLTRAAGKRAVKEMATTLELSAADDEADPPKKKARNAASSKVVR